MTRHFLKSFVALSSIVALSSFSACRSGQSNQLSSTEMQSESVLKVCRNHTSAIETSLSSFKVRVNPVSKGLRDAICLMEVTFPDQDSFLTYVDQSIQTEEAINKIIVVDGEREFTYDLLLAVSSEGSECKFLKGENQYLSWREDSSRKTFTNSLPDTTASLGIKSHEAYFYVTKPFSGADRVNLKWSNVINGEMMQFEDAVSYKETFLAGLIARSLPLTILKIESQQTACIPFILDFSKYKKVARASVGT